MNSEKKEPTRWTEGIQKMDALIMILALGALSAMMGLMVMFGLFEMNADSSEALIGGFRTMIITFLAGSIITLAILCIGLWLKSQSR